MNVLNCSTNKYRTSLMFTSYFITKSQIQRSTVWYLKQLQRLQLLTSIFTVDESFFLINWSVVWSEDVLKNVLSCPQPKDRSWDQRVSLKNDSKCIFWITSVVVKNSWTETSHDQDQSDSCAAWHRIKTYKPKTKGRSISTWKTPTEDKDCWLISSAAIDPSQIYYCRYTVNVFWYQ